jgi:hypothetical protein
LLRLHIKLPEIKWNCRGVFLRRREEIDAFQKSPGLTGLSHAQKDIWLLVSNMTGLFSISFFWDVIPTPLTKSIIFQDGYCTTNQI